MYDFGILIHWKFMSSLAIFYLPKYSLPPGYSFVLLTAGDSMGSAVNFSSSFFEFSKMTWPLKVRIFQKIFERWKLLFPKMNAKLYSEVHSGWILRTFFGKGIWCKARSQRPRIDLNKKFLPRPNATTAWKLIPHRSNISKN